ncbi:MAG TPA: hypothetical protein VIT23_11970, partial [Terrimicrobiaceae bacterium]
LKDNLPLLIPRPKIPVTFDSKSVIKKALHPFFLPAPPPFAETFRMNPIFTPPLAIVEEPTNLGEEQVRARS